MRLNFRERRLRAGLCCLCGAEPVIPDRDPKRLGRMLTVGAECYRINKIKRGKYK